MRSSLFTAICDCKDGTYVWQCNAAAADQFAHSWATMLLSESPVPRASGAIAADVFCQLDEFGSPTSLDGLQSTWQMGGSVADAFYTLTIVETA